MNNPSVREILDQWLTEHGYDGLYTEDCGCEVGDLAPCSEQYSFGCRAGHKVPCDPETCPAEGECPFHIGKKTDGAKQWTKKD